MLNKEALALLISHKLLSLPLVSSMSKLLQKRVAN